MFDTILRILFDPEWSVQSKDEDAFEASGASPEICWDCQGDGHLEHGDCCPTCGGTGQIYH